MRIAFTPEQEKLRHELRDYFDQFMTDEYRQQAYGSGMMEGGTPLYWDALRKMGEDGWLGIGWPEKYGGRGATPIEQMLFADAAQTANFPFPFLTIGTVGPTLARYGSDAQRAEYLPRILRGEINFCIGYTEPQAGTDLAALDTRAVRDGDEWVITGQKVFTSLANFAQYCWLAARTNTEVPKHQGLSMFIVPMDAPGVSVTPIEVVGGMRTNATFYDEVRIPAHNLVAEEGQGWNLIVSQLNHERVSLTPWGPPMRLIEETRKWAQDTKLPPNSSGYERVIDQPWVQLNLAKARAKAEVVKLMNWETAWAMTHSALGPAMSSATKVYCTEFAIEAYELLMEVLGPASTIKRDETGALLRGEVEGRYCTSLILTFGGGTNEVQRDIIAMAGLGLPHYKS